jgi:hypothetical protein
MFEKFIKPTKNFFWPKQINTCLMILNEKPNYAVSRRKLSNFCRTKVNEFLEKRK